MKTKSLGRYIVADPAISHGEPTFRGTRILVADVLEQLSTGMAWEAIIEEWRGALSKEAIAAIKISSGPIGTPRFSSLARIPAADLAAAASNGMILTNNYYLSRYTST